MSSDELSDGRHLPNKDQRNSQGNISRSYSRSMHFDDVIIQLGQFGRYQKRQYFLLCLPAILCAFHQLAAVFLSFTPDFRCELPKSVFNGTDTYLIQNDEHRQAIAKYIPLENDSTNDTVKYKTCDLKVNGSAEECNSYVYSKEFLTSSIVTEWDIVCKETVKSTTSVSVYMAGVLVGAFAFGIISDVIGRKKTLLICIALQGSSGLATAFSPEYYTFIILRFLAGCASMGLFMTAFVLGMELVGPKYRLLGGIVIEYFFALGYVLLTGVAYGVKQWNYLQIAISVPSFLFLSYFWFVTESARWLLAKDRSEEAEQIVQKAAQVNGVKLPDKVFENMEEKTTHESFSAVFKAPVLLRRTLIIWFNWAVVAMGYYGLSLNSGSLGGNVFINFMLGGLVEFPAYTFCFLCNKLGRKWPHVFGLMVGGFACLGTVLVEKFHPESSEKNTYFVVLNMVGKFGMTIGFCIIYFWSAEIYPTGVRNSLMGFSSTWARLGTIAAPYVADLGLYVPKEYGKILPASIFGSLVIIGGLLSIILPETTGHSLPETVAEANLFPNHDKEKKPSTNRAYSSDEMETKFGPSFKYKTDVY